MFVDFRYTLPALLETFAKFGPQIAKIPAVTVKKGLYYVNLSPNTGYLAVNLKKKEAYQVSQIGDPKGKDSSVSGPYLAYILDRINQKLDKQ